MVGVREEWLGIGLGVFDLVGRGGYYDHEDYGGGELAGGAGRRGKKETGSARQVLMGMRGAGVDTYIGRADRRGLGNSTAQLPNVRRARPSLFCPLMLDRLRRSSAALCHNVPPILMECPAAKVLIFAAIYTLDRDHSLCCGRILPVVGCPQSSARRKAALGCIRARRCIKITSSCGPCLGLFLCSLKLHSLPQCTARSFLAHPAVDRCHPSDCIDRLELRCIYGFSAVDHSQILRKNHTSCKRI